MTGTYEHSIDTAGRLIVPAKLRDKLGCSFYMAVGSKENLTLYPMDAWNGIKAKVAALPLTERLEMDVFFASAQLCEVDKQWRFQVPSYLKEYAKIDRDVVITGNNDRAQIWSSDNWKAKTRQQLNPETIANLMETLGI